ncbi:MAG: 30S ribosomal protein S20 [Oscillospiraceae bacterium]|nr:30S ribosomal protein S20 [Oscillospiraceae bacterium]
MPNIKSAKKRVSISAVENARNRANRTHLKTVLKKFDTAIAGDDKKVITEAYLQAVKEIDKSAAKGILHKNTAARRKSSITRKYNAIA